MTSPITTHVLDTANGRPASGVLARLEFYSKNEWLELGKGSTNSDGRITDLLKDQSIQSGSYRIIFEVSSYLNDQGFYKSIPICFEVTDASAHYHVPLLLSPYGYSTYRGS